MAITQNDIKPGIFETIANEPIGVLILNQWTTFKLDGYFPFLISDIVVKQGGTTIPSSNYETAIDTYATDQEVGLSNKSLRGAIKITNIAYAGVALTVSGFNFGTYSSTQGVKDYLANLLLQKTQVEGSNIDDGEVATFVGGGANIKSDNSSAIAQWQLGSIYNLAGTLVRREGITYSATGQATNQGFDPSDPDNALYWYEPDSARDLKRYANRGKIIDGDFHTINDRQSANYQQNLRINKTKVGGANKDLHMIHLDGETVTGNTTLEALLLNNPYIDLIAPEVIGIRTLIDMSSRHIAPQSSGGDNDVLGGVLEDRFQGHGHEIWGYSGSSGGFGPPSDSTGFSATKTNLASTGWTARFAETDGVSGTTRTGATTRPKEFTVGASYIIVMVDA